MDVTIPQIETMLTEYEQHMQKPYNSTPTLTKNESNVNETRLTTDTAQRILAAYEDDSTLSNVQVSQDGDTTHVRFEVEEREFEVSVDNGTVGDLRESMAESLNDYEDFDSAVSAHEIEMIDQTRNTLRDAANTLRKDADIPPIEYEPLNDRIEADFSDSYNQASSEVQNYDPITEENIEQMIEDYEFDHGNSEVYVRDNEVEVTIEAPNHATVSIYHNLAEDGDTIQAFRETMIREMQDFSAEKTFDEIWSPKFGEHNSYSADQFYVMNYSDERYFDARSRDIRNDMNNM